MRARSFEKPVILILGVLCCLLVSVAFTPLLGMPRAVAEEGMQVDSVTSATPNYRTFYNYNLKEMPLTGGNYTCLKSQEPFTYFTQEWYGVSLSYLLDTEVGLKDDTTAVKVIAADNYSVTLTLSELRDKNSQGLETILGWKKGEENKTGGTITELTNEEGPFRLIVPQKKVGKHPDGTPNWNKAVRTVRAIEVQPTSPGVPSVNAEAIPAGEIVIYGNILNRRTFTVNELKSIKGVSGTYHWKNKKGTEGDSEFTGIPLSYLLERVVGLGEDANEVAICASDGFSKTLSMEEVDGPYPGGLSTLLAWEEDGKALKPEPDGDGPIKSILPQANKDDVNKSKWIKNVRVLEVNPAEEALSGAGEAVPDPGKVPSDRIIVCGNIDPGNIPSTWYLAEGYTGGGFEEWICIANPNSWETKAEIEYMIEGENPVKKETTIKARSRKSIRVNDVVGDGKNVSAKVVGNHGDSLVVERAMYWNNRSGGSAAAGVTDPKTEWYLAEGCTAGGFETWILVQNPNDKPANVTFTYMDKEGEKKGPVVPLKAHSRQTFNAADTLPNNWQVSTKVESDIPVIAERAMYWNNRSGGSAEKGQDSPKFRSFLAEGCTAGGFETWVLIQNPKPVNALVYLTYLTADKVIERAPLFVPAGSRVTINEGADVGETYDVSCQIVSTVPVVVERTTYWANRDEGSCSFGYPCW
ncbi:MAG: molybdopterin-dependent oxidoreductase [Actinomycetota bacterium]|nr:molybdopterin-dependent oxidoreductase [Actinomycetota bacterium]